MKILYQNNILKNEVSKLNEKVFVELKSFSQSVVNQ